MKQLRIWALVIITTFFCITDLFAQPGYQDVVYLKNGSIIRGIIIEQVPSQSIKIQTKDKSVFVFKMDEIEKMSKEKPARKEKFDMNLSLNKDVYSGFAISIEAAIGSGTGSYNDGQGIASVHAMLGYMHQSYFTMGMSLGFSQWSSQVTNYIELEPTVDACIALRLFPLKKRLSPFVMCDFGYGMVTDNEYSGGLQYAMGGGLRINLTNRRAASLGLIYKSQFFKRNEYYNYNSYYNNQQLDVSSLYLNGVCLQMGFTF